MDEIFLFFDQQFAHHILEEYEILEIHEKMLCMLIHKVLLNL